MSPAETLPSESSEVENKPDNLESLLDDISKRRNELQEQIHAQQTELNKKQDEYNDVNSEWKKLGGERIDKAHAAVIDAINNPDPSDPQRLPNAQKELMEAKKAFKTNMENPDVVSAEKSTEPAPDSPTHESNQEGLLDTSGEINPDALPEPSEENRVESAASGQDHIADGDGAAKSLAESESTTNDGAIQGELVDADGSLNPDAIAEAPSGDEKETKKAAAEASNQEFKRLIRERLDESDRNAAERARVAEAEAANARLATPYQAEPTTGTPDVDTTGGEERTDYNSSLARALENMARNLSGRAENLEERGGVKGIALRMLKRMGRGIYKYSGVENEVRGVKLTAENVKNRYGAAKDRHAARVTRRQERRAQRKQERQDRANARLEQQVLDYQDYLRKREAAKARKEARKQRNKQIRHEAWQDMKTAAGEMGNATKDYLGATRTAKFGRGALNQMRGAWGYARGAAGAMHQAGLAERQNRMNS